MPIISKAKTVDLGTLNWGLEISKNRYIYYSSIQNMKQSPNGNTVPNFYCPMYTAVTVNKAWVDKDMSWKNAIDSNTIAIVNNDYTDTQPFKAAMSGVMLTYETVDTVEECIVTEKKNILDPSWPWVDGSGYTAGNLRYTYDTNKIVTLNGTYSGVGNLGMFDVGKVPAGYSVYVFALSDGYSDSDVIYSPVYGGINCYLLRGKTGINYNNARFGIVITDGERPQQYIPNGEKITIEEVIL